MRSTTFTPPSSLAPLDLGWLVGLVEGEGSFVLRLKPGKTQPYILDMSVQVVSTDKDIIDRLHSLVGGTVYGPRLKVNRKPCWSWRVQKRDDVAALLSDIKPLLGERRQERATELLDAYNTYARPRRKTR